MSIKVFYLISFELCFISGGRRTAQAASGKTFHCFFFIFILFFCFVLGGAVAARARVGGRRKTQRRRRAAQTGRNEVLDFLMTKQILTFISFFLFVQKIAAAPA